MKRTREIALALVGLALAAPACGGGSGLRGGGETPGGGDAGDVPCHQITDEQACNLRGAACRADDCPQDCVNVTAFVRCAEPSDPRLSCVRLPCMPPCASSGGSVSVSSSLLCNAESWCHPIYTEMAPPEVCPSPLNCTTYSRCGDNSTVPCAGTNAPLCGQDAPTCATGYRPGIDSAGCYEGGCVPLSYCSSR